MKIALLLTGNELMSGDTVDSNSAYIAQSLKELGLMPDIKHVVGDDLALLVQSLEQLARQADVLIINGGLGPTEDDMTAQALATWLNVPLTPHPEAQKELEKWSERTQFALTPANLKQANLPKGSDIILNPHGSAVGIRYQSTGCLILCTPGVPYEMKPMIDQQLMPLLAAQLGDDQRGIVSRLRLFGIAESILQDKINALWPNWPDNVELGFRVQLPVLEVKIITQGAQHAALNEHWVTQFCEQFNDYIIGYDGTRLPQALNQTLLAQNKKITVAESCTGGLIASQITSEAGSSGVFEAGFVTYSNQIKHELLSVKLETLEQYGAVSEQTVLEMASGALSVSNADIAIAVSGIAGPGGGTDDKPVGTVWIAWGTPNKLQARRFFVPFDRTKFQLLTAAIAMDLVRRTLLQLPVDVEYFERS